MIDYKYKIIWTMQNIVSFPKERTYSFKSLVYYGHDISSVLNVCGNTNIIIAESDHYFLFRVSLIYVSKRYGK